MIIENNITLWIQIAPNIIPSKPSRTKKETEKEASRNDRNHCTVFPIDYFANLNSSYSQGVSNFESFYYENNTSFHI